MRVPTPKNTVKRYARAMQQGMKFPRIVVVFDGTKYLVDGFCRYEAAKLNNLTTIEAVVFLGTLDDALRMAFGANAHHGEPRTAADKVNVVRAASLKHPDYSNALIAEIVGVSKEFVRKQRELHKYPVAVKLPGRHGVILTARKK